MRTYELMFILQDEMEEEAVTTYVAGIQQVMTDNGGEVIDVDVRGRRRLAYPIRKRRHGIYTLINARLEHTAILEVERALKLSEDVLRYLVIRQDETEEATETEE